MPKYQRQTMSFSATMNTKIQDLSTVTQRPVRVMIDPPKSATKLVQEFVRIRKRDNPSHVIVAAFAAKDRRQQESVFVARIDLPPVAGG